MADKGTLNSRIVGIVSRATITTYAGGLSPNGSSYANLAMRLVSPSLPQAPTGRRAPMMLVADPQFSSE